MIRAAFVVSFVVGIVTAALAYDYPMVPYTNRHGPMLNAGPNGPMMPSIFDLTPPPVNPCTGTADFSDGCAMAVFH